MSLDLLDLLSPWPPFGGGAAAGPSTGFLLLEDGSSLLLEDGGHILLEGGPAASPAADLLEAIWDACDADADLTADFGRTGWLWRDEAPAGEPLPFAVLLDPDADTAWESEDEDGNRPSQARHTLQVSVFATTRAQAKRLSDAILALLNVAELVFVDGYLMGAWAGDPHDVLDPEKGPGGVDVWQRVATVEALTGHYLNHP